MSCCTVSDTKGVATLSSLPSSPPSTTGVGVSTSPSPSSMLLPGSERIVFGSKADRKVTSETETSCLPILPAASRKDAARDLPEHAPVPAVLIKLLC